MFCAFAKDRCPQSAPEPADRWNPTGGCSDVLFLDMALEGTGRRAVEAALPALRAAASRAGEGGEGAGRQLRGLLRVAAACLEAVCLSAPGHSEARLCLNGLQVIDPQQSWPDSMVVHLLVDNSATLTAPSACKTCLGVNKFRV